MIGSHAAVGVLVEYYDRRTGEHVQARVVIVEDFEGREGGKYLTLDNDMCIHEDQCRPASTRSSH